MLREIAEILEEPDVSLDLDFQPGQVQWINNATIGHRRTSYLDDPTIRASEPYCAYGFVRLVNSYLG